MLKEIRSGSMDLAALALWPYAIGFFVAVSYYSKFRIFSIDLLNAQYVIVGIYVIALYFGIPFLVLRLAALFPERAQLVLAALSLLIVDLILVYLLKKLSSIPTSYFVVLHLLPMQFVGFWRGSLWRIDLSQSPGALRLIIVVLLISLHFSYSLLGRVPYYLGGAEPVEVFVFPATEKLDTLQSVLYKDTYPELGSKHKAFKLRLLYETQDEFFFQKRRFPREHPSETVSISIMRIRKDMVDRLEYYSPKWLTVNAGGVK